MNPAQHLVGQTIEGIWVVEEAINLSANGSTGGAFCIPYLVKHIRSGQKAFLKVLDVVGAIMRYSASGVGLAETLSRITSAHVFETQLLKDCEKRRLDRVVRALAYGEIYLPVPPLGPIGFPYLIFELGDGDTHKFMDATKPVDHAWWLSTMHQATIGLWQLHGIETAHQDLKPSNVVFFGVDNAKVADLGRAARKGIGSLNDGRAGDQGYIAPEYYYGYIPVEWSERFLALDLYLLGNLAFIGIMSVSMTTALFQAVAPEFNPVNYRGDYVDALPALVKALGDVLEQTRPSIPDAWRDPFISTIEQLCHPDPAKRGHPKNHSSTVGEKYSLERYVSAFNRMATTARAHAIR